MKPLTLTFLFALFAGLLLAGEPIQIPTEMKLANGGVLRNVSVVRWENDRVVLRHAGGVDPVQFIHMDPAAKPIWEALRSQEIAKAASKAPQAATGATTATAPANTISVRGEAFIVTRGAGNYKLGGITVFAFPMTQWEENSPIWRLEKAIGSARTDSEGRFTLSVPANTPFFLYARGERLAGGTRENYLWLARSDSFSSLTAVQLSNHNLITRNLSIQVID